MINQELNPAYTSRNFVVGTSNKSAHIGAQNIIGNPDLYTILFIHGPAGTGKTHLLHTIGKRIKSAEHSVLITNGEEMSRPRSDYFDYYLQPQVLIIDDLAGLRDLPNINEVFSVILKQRLLEKRRIVVTDRIHPQDFTRFGSDITSRLLSGLVAYIDYPDEELRMSILTARINALPQIPIISPEILEYLSDTFSKNIELMLSALYTLITHFESHETSPSLEQAKSILSQNEKPSGIIDPRKIIRETAIKFKVTPTAIIGQGRQPEQVLPRHVAMFLTRLYTTLSCAATGQALGGRDHATVVHACTRIEEKLRTSYWLRRDLQTIRDHLPFS